MDTTAKMSKRAKGRLEALRLEVARRSGRRVTQREVLEHLIDRAARDPATEASAFLTTGATMSKEDFRRFLRRRKPSGVPDMSVDIDRHLYGGRP